MKKFFVFVSVIFSVFAGFSFATYSITNISYNIDGDDVEIYRTDNSDGGYMDINLQDPETNDRLHLETVRFSDESFKYTKQWDGVQKIWVIPGDESEDIRFTIPSSSSVSKEKIINEISEKTDTNVTRTVIPTVPKTGPSGNIIGIVLATLAIFGGYIYIRKRADI